VTAVSADGSIGIGAVDAEVQVKPEEIPSVNAGPDITVYAGQVLVRAGSVTVENGTPIEATVNYGDGTGAQPITLNADGTFVLSHQYTNTGVFTATVQVTDSVGAIGTASFGVNTLAVPAVNMPAVQLLPVTLALTHSAEFYVGIVRQEYQLVLQRTPEAAAVTYWGTQIQGGLSQQNFAAALLSSTEFVASQSNAAWLDSVYQRLFNRTPDESGQQYWNGLLAGGTSKGSVATAITNSVEFLQTQIAGYYNQILGRAADAGGLAFWTAKLATGSRLEDVAANLLASDEFFSGASHGNNNAVTWIDAAYAAAFGRQGSTAEEAFWIGQI
jgi:hypothetical protein